MGPSHRFGGAAAYFTLKESEANRLPATAKELRGLFGILQAQPPPLVGPDARDRVERGVVWAPMMAQRLPVETKSERGIVVEPLGVLERDGPVGKDDAVSKLSKRRRPAA